MICKMCDEEKRGVGFELRTLSNMIKRNFDSSDSKKCIDNMTGMHGYIIGFLYNNRDRDMFQRDIENEFSIRRSTATKILQLMEKNDLIKRKSVPYDARLKKIVLTDSALKNHDMVVSEISMLEKRLVNGISEDELKCFYLTIEKMKKNLIN